MFAGTVKTEEPVWQKANPNGAATNAIICWNDSFRYVQAKKTPRFRIEPGHYHIQGRNTPFLPRTQGSPWAQGADSPYQGEMARRAKEGRDAGPEGLRGFERSIVRSTLKLETNPLRHFLRKYHLPLSCGARQEEALGAFGEFVLPCKFQTQS